MNKRIYIFKYNGQELERVDWDIEQCDIEIIKSCLSYIKSIPSEEIDMDIVNDYTPEVSEKMFIRNDGALMYRLAGGCSAHVTGFQPALDINHEELFYEFLDLITKKDIDNAITYY